MRSVDEGERCPKCRCTVGLDADGTYICGCEDSDDEDFPDDNDEGP